jgi:uncharacterized metal-binding protein
LSRFRVGTPRCFSSCNAKTDFNVLLGLCLGQIPCFKYSQAPTTVLVVKDRVFGHNPIAALHQADMFYRWLAETI